MHVEHNVRLRHVCIRLTQNRDTSMSVIVRLSVGWLARIAQTQSCRGDKLVIGEEFLRPWNRKITTNWENWLPKHFFTDHSHSGEGDCPHRLPPMDPPLLATVVTFRSLCERTTGCVCPSSVSISSAAQSHSSSWTQKRVFRPCYVDRDQRVTAKPYRQP